MNFLKSCVPPVLSAGLFFYSFVPEWGWCLAHVALVPLFVSMCRVKSRLFHVWLFGACFGGAYFYWLKVFTAPAPIVMTFFHSFWICLALWPALLPAVRGRGVLMAAAVFWILSEYLRSLGAYGYEWGGLGYTQYGNVRLAAYARHVGMPGVCALVLASNVILTWAILKKDFRWVAGLTAYGIVLALASPQPRLSPDIGPAGEFALLQTNVSPYLRAPDRDEAIKSQIAGFAAQTSHSKSRFFILPETLFSSSITGLRGFLLEEPRDILNPLIHPYPDRMLVVGAIEEDTGGFYNAAILFDAAGARSGSYRKTHLVPFGESIPGFEANRWARWFGEKLGTPFFSAGDTCAPLQMGNVRAAVLICFEGTFSRLVAASAAGADLILNISNDAWSESAFGHEQHLRFLRFRAIETGLPVIRVGNSGPTAVFAPNGERVFHIPHPNAAVLDLNPGSY